MEHARHLLNIASGAPDDDAHLLGDKLTDRQESFAKVWAETDNKAAAYRKCYSVGERTKPETIWAAASRIAAIPAVRARYNELRELSLLETIVSIRELFQWYVDIATADPNEIIRTRTYCCRYCYGVNHHYQWKDQDEYSLAVARSLDAEGATPVDGIGGFGFDPFLEPHPLCTECLGGGTPRVIVSDTTKLTGKAKKLYKGAKQDRFGCIEILLHDQDKAREQIGRMLGAFKDVVDLRSNKQKMDEEAAAKLSSTVSEADAAKAYLKLLS